MRPDLARQTAGGPETRGRGVRLRELQGGQCQAASEAWTWEEIPVRSPGAPQLRRRDPNTRSPRVRVTPVSTGPAAPTGRRKTVPQREEPGQILILLQVPVNTFKEKEPA